MSICLTEAGGYEVRKEGYLPSTVEPFVFKGGITAEMQVMAISYTGNAALRLCILQRLLPTMDSPKDLYSQQKAPNPSPLIFTIRPYRPEDKVLVFVFLKFSMYILLCHSTVTRVLGVFRDRG